MRFNRILFLMLIMVILACDDDAVPNPDGFNEVVTQIEGSWKIDQVLQNGQDITEFVDFQSFSLDFSYQDGLPSTFSLSDFNSPFVLKVSSGNWNFDDPIYPTMINFSDGTELAINGPVLSGGNELVLTVPLGCGTNGYVYKLIR